MPVSRFMPVRNPRISARRLPQPAGLWIQSLARPDARIWVPVSRKSVASCSEPMGGGRIPFKACSRAGSMKSTGCRSPGAIQRRNPRRSMPGRGPVPRDGHVKNAGHMTRRRLAKGWTSHAPGMSRCLAGAETRTVEARHRGGRSARPWRKPTLPALEKARFRHGNRIVPPVGRAGSMAGAGQGRGGNEASQPVARNVTLP